MYLILLSTGGGLSVWGVWGGLGRLCRHRFPRHVIIPPLGEERRSDVTRRGVGEEQERRGAGEEQDQIAGF